MANPSSVGVETESVGMMYEPGLVQVDTTARSITLNVEKQYTIAHSGVDASGADSSSIIRMAFEANGTPGYTSGTNHLLLIDESTQVIGPGLSTMRFNTASGTVMMNLVPVVKVWGQL
jgi:hypothetical protein